MLAYNLDSNHEVSELWAGNYNNVFHKYSYCFCWQHVAHRSYKRIVQHLAIWSPGNSLRIFFPLSEKLLQIELKYTDQTDKMESVCQWFWSFP